MEDGEHAALLDWDSEKTDHLVQLYSHICVLGSTSGMVRSNGSHSHETNAKDDDAGENASLKYHNATHISI
ncbi:hypothetical protein QFZ77_001408 [Paenibacillus sp. V4I3]|uniref:hypothetical protein n=1 Tax=Paenibacillus sp. V4I3 TaxID=3042305 RepID=UPI002785CE87|nr:hypothetical protein [Paenibacillus sp. V4I3]MDQ0872749.1 hypothetical protein [Paenibacillus sp. V4I3]